jgi:hypothetical protein
MGKFAQAAEMEQKEILIIFTSGHLTNSNCDQDVYVL